MNDQNPISNVNPEEPVSQATQNPVAQDIMGFKSGVDKIKPILKAVFDKFYSNKKIFWPVTIAFGLIFLIIVLGLLFGKRGPGPSQARPPTPTPAIASTPQASSSGNILDDSQSKLSDLKKQINALDVRQSRLQPPTLNFDIKF